MDLDTLCASAARRLGLPLAVAALSMAHAVEAAPIRCEIPKIEACPTCLRKVVVKPLANGTCRVSFEISSEVLRPGSAGTVIVEIEPPSRRPAIARRQVRPRRVAARTVPVASPRAKPTARCFQFNGQSFCE